MIPLRFPWNVFTRSLLHCCVCTKFWICILSMIWSSPWSSHPDGAQFLTTFSVMLTVIIFHPCFLIQASTLSFVGLRRVTRPLPVFPSGAPLPQWCDGIHVLSWQATPLHHAWSLEVFQNEESLQVVHHKGALGPLQGGRATVKQFVLNCWKVLLGRPQSGPAFMWS